MSDNVKVSVSIGDAKVELEGEKGFVEHKLKELLPLVTGDLPGTDHKKAGLKSQIKVEKTETGRTLRAFMEEKKPQNASQAIAVVMFYKRDKEKQVELTADEVRNALRQGNFRPPGNIAQALVDCKRRFGYVDRGSARGMWKLVHQGEALVEFDLPGNPS